MARFDMLDFNVKFVQRHFSELKEVKPMFLVHCEDTYIPIMAAWEDEKRKQDILNLIRLLILRNKAHAYSIIHEAWMKMVTAEELENMKGGVKDQPGRKEVVLISFVSDDRNESVSMDILRDGEKVTLGEPRKMDGMEGRFHDLLPPQHVRDRVTPEKEKELDALIELLCLVTNISMELKPMDKDGKESETRTTR